MRGQLLVEGPAVPERIVDTALLCGPCDVFSQWKGIFRRWRTKSYAAAWPWKVLGQLCTSPHGHPILTLSPLAPPTSAPLSLWCQFSSAYLGNQKYCSLVIFIFSVHKFSIYEVLPLKAWSLQSDFLGSSIRSSITSCEVTLTNLLLCLHFLIVK